MPKAMKISGMKENTPWFLLGAVVLGGGGFLAYKFLSKKKGEEYVGPDGYVDQGPPLPGQDWPPSYADSWQDNYAPPQPSYDGNTLPPVQSTPPQPGGPGATPTVTPTDSGTGTTSTVGTGSQSGSSITTTGTGTSTPGGTATTTSAGGATQRDTGFPSVTQPNLTQVQKFISMFQALAKARPAIAAALAQVGQAMRAAQKAYQAVRVDDTGGATAGIKAADAFIAQSFREAANVKIAQEREATKLLLNYFNAEWLAFKAQLNRQGSAVVEKYKNQARVYAQQLQALIGAAIQAMKDAQAKQREQQANGSGGSGLQQTTQVTATTGTPRATMPRSGTISTGATQGAQNSGGSVVKDTRTGTMSTTTTEERKNDVRSGSSLTTTQARPAASTSIPTTTQARSASTSTADQVRASRNGTVQTNTPINTGSTRTVGARPAAGSPTTRRQPMTTTGSPAPAPATAYRSSASTMAANTRMAAQRAVPTTAQATRATPTQTSFRVAPATTVQNAAAQATRATQTATQMQAQASQANRMISASRPTTSSLLRR